MPATPQIEGKPACVLREPSSHRATIKPTWNLQLFSFTLAFPLFSVFLLSHSGALRFLSRRPSYTMQYCLVIIFRRVSIGACKIRGQVTHRSVDRVGFAYPSIQGWYMRTESIYITASLGGGDVVGKSIVIDVRDSGSNLDSGRFLGIEGLTVLLPGL